MLVVLLGPRPLDLIESIIKVVLKLAQVLQLSDIICDLLLVCTFEFSPKR